jgi:hypothetical protein
MALNLPDWRSLDGVAAKSGWQHSPSESPHPNKGGGRSFVAASGLGEGILDPHEVRMATYV